jgi:electron transfer flavoprotein alpha subunit
MSNEILVITEHLGGKLADISYEMVGKAKELAGELGGTVTAVVLGSGAESLAEGLGGDATLYVDDPALAEFNPEACCRVVAALVEERSPRLVMFGYTSMGMDVASWLSARTGAPHVAYVNGLSANGGGLSATSQLYGGKIMAESVPGGETAIVSVLAGAFPVETGQGSAPVEKIASPASLDNLKVTFVKLIEPEGGDVDITAEAKLISIGRGIGSEEDIEVAEELAEALGASLSASRPITDAGWLPKTRQVGKSGVSVKPKLYLTLGISGAPEHVEGIRSAELIIAVNTDPKAPIFDVAHYGTTHDLFDIAEALTEKLDG